MEDEKKVEVQDQTLQVVEENNLTEKILVPKEEVKKESQEINEPRKKNKKIIPIIILLVILLGVAFLGFSSSQNQESKLDMFITKFNNTLSADTYTMTLRKSNGYEKEIEEIDRLDYILINGKAYVGIVESEGFLKYVGKWGKESLAEDLGFEYPEQLDNIQNTSVYYETGDITSDSLMGALCEGIADTFFSPFDSDIPARYFLSGLLASAQAYEKQASSVDFITSYQAGENTLRMKVEVLEYLYWYQTQEVAGRTVNNSVINAIKEIASDISYEVSLKVKEDYVTEFTIEVSSIEAEEILLLEYEFYDINKKNEDLELCITDYNSYLQLLESSY